MATTMYDYSEKNDADADIAPYTIKVNLLKPAVNQSWNNKYVDNYIANAYHEATHALDSVILKGKLGSSL